MEENKLTSQQMLSYMDIFHKWQRLNYGKLHLICTVRNFTDCSGIELELVDALNDVEPGEYCRYIYSDDDVESAETKVEYMQRLILRYGGRVE